MKTDSTISNIALDYIRAISPYQPGKPISALSRELHIPEEKIIKLASNENPLGLSPMAQIAIEKSLSGLARYPDQFELKNAIYNITRKNKIVKDRFF